MKEDSEAHHKAYLRQLIYGNQIIEAVKYIRELTGLGLKESKELCNLFHNDLSKLDDYSFTEYNVSLEDNFLEFEIQDKEFTEFDIQETDEVSENEALTLVASMEKMSEHPLARAIVEAAAGKNLILHKTDGFEALSGMGVAARVDGHDLLLGNVELMEQKKVSGYDRQNAVESSMQFAGRGKTPLYLAMDGKLIVIID